MLGALRRRLSFANVVSLMALFVALGTGGAYAANTIGSDDIIDESILSQDLKNQEVRSSDIHNAGVTNDKLQSGSVTTGKVADETLTADDLATNSVNATEIADSSIDSGEIVNDSLFDTDLATGSVRSPEIQDGQVANADLGSNSVTSAKVASNTLTTADIAGAAVSGHVNLNGIANGRCTQVDFGVSGAQPGDVAFVATGAAIQNGIVMSAARVKSANVVEVNACNFSGGAMTTISDFPVRVVTLR